MNFGPGWISLLLIVLPLPAIASSQEIIDLQVRLAKAHASPGVIDGVMGKNTRTAIKGFQRIHNFDPTGELDEKTRERLEAQGNAPTMRDYTLTEADLEGPFLDEVPVRMVEMSELDGLHYTSPLERLAEKFHVDQDLLKSLNPDADFQKPGSVIRVPNLAGLTLESPVQRIEVDKEASTVSVYDSAGKLTAVYPATIGSDETPSPSGEHTIVVIAESPTYHYDPDSLDFDDVPEEKQFTIAPGPNNPVGLVWIGLDAPGYGIHGSPTPSNIRREKSHGCVRLTNWDALTLARAVKKGVPVSFVPTRNDNNSP